MMLLPTLDRSGPSRVVVECALHLDRSRFEPVVCSMRRPDPEVAADLGHRGVEVMTLEMGGLLDISAVGGLADICRHRNVQVMHNHGFRAELYGVLAAKRASVPVSVATLHMDFVKDVRMTYGRCHERLARLLLRRFVHPRHDAVVAVSQAAREAAIEKAGFHGDMRVIRNGISPGPFVTPLTGDDRAAILTSLGSGLQFVNIAAVCPHIKRKGLQYLVEAAAVLARRVPSARLLLIGSGPLTRQLQQMARHRCVEHVVRFCGFREDVPTLMRALDMLTLPSLSEGLPIAVLEAMAAGLPVVASRVGGIPEAVVHGETGLLVQAGDVSGLAAALSELAVDRRRGRAFGEAGRVRFQRMFRAERMASEYAALYDELLGRDATWER